MSRFLLEYHNEHMVFESEEDLVRYLAINNFISVYKISKISDLIFFENEQLLQIINKEKLNLKKDKRIKLGNELLILDKELAKMESEYSYLKPQNEYSRKLLSLEIANLKQSIKLKEQLRNKYV